MLAQDFVGPVRVAATKNRLAFTPKLRPAPSDSLQFAKLRAIRKKFVSLCDEQHDPPRFWVTHGDGDGTRFRR